MGRQFKKNLCLNLQTELNEKTKTFGFSKISCNFAALKSR
jgi:hypothetical protein